MPSLVRIGQVFMVKSRKCKKFIDRQKDGQTDGRRTKSGQKSSRAYSSGKLKKRRLLCRTKFDRVRCFIVAKGKAGAHEFTDFQHTGA